MTTVSALRAQLIGRIWSDNGKPTNGLDSITADVADPLATHSLSPTNLLRVDRGSCVMLDNSSATITTVEPYIFHPTVGTANGRLALYGPGHATLTHVLTLGTGDGSMIKQLVEAGYVTACVEMPYANVDPAVTVANHDALPTPTGSLNHLRVFVETFIRCINEFSTAGNVVMCGKSGGGWGTFLTAAIEPRIVKSAPVAGGWPLGMTEGSRDWEQFLPGVDDIVDYGDLMLMSASSGRGMRAKYNTLDSCCFTLAQYQTFEFGKLVSLRAAELGGSFELEFYTTTAHAITTQARADIISFFG